MKGLRLVTWVVGALLVGVVAVTVARPAGPVRADIGNAQLRELQIKGARLIDVRSAGEFDLGHIPGAENVPIENLTRTAGAWDKDKAVVVYCATGARSLNAAQWLAANGFRKVYNFKAGIAAWDGEVTKDARPVAAVPTSGKPVFIDFYSDT